MTEKEIVDAITKEVVEFLGKGMPYNAAFAEAAHARGIWHHQNRERYNYLFRRVKRRVNKKNSEPAATTRRTPARIRPPSSDFARLAANDRD